MPTTPHDRLISVLNHVETTEQPEPLRKNPPLFDKTVTKSKRGTGRKARSDLNVLRRARKLLSKGYVRHEIAVNAEIDPVDPTDPSAIAFCMTGALQAVVYKRSRGPAAAARIERLAKRLVKQAGVPIRRGIDNPIERLAFTNDMILNNRADVLDVFDRTIEEMEAKLEATSGGE